MSRLRNYLESLEQSVIVFRDAEKLDLIVNHASRDDLICRQPSNQESTAQLLENAAKILESKFSDQAFDLYKKADGSISTANENRPKEVN